MAPVETVTTKVLPPELSHLAGPFASRDAAFAAVQQHLKSQALEVRSEAAITTDRADRAASSPHPPDQSQQVLRLPVHVRALRLGQRPPMRLADHLQARRRARPDWPECGLARHSAVRLTRPTSR